MKKIVLFLSFLVVTLSSCGMISGISKQYSIPLTSVELNGVKLDANTISADGSTFKDGNVTITWTPMYEQLDFVIRNTTSDLMKMSWDDASFVNVDGVASRVIHKGIHFSEREKEQAPSPIPGGASLDELIIPTDNIYYSSILKTWLFYPLIPKAKNGKTIKPAEMNQKEFKVLLPIDMNGKRLNYTFTFTVCFTGKR